MNILGLHIGHDAAACLIRDDRLVCMIEKERLTRQKYDRGYCDEMVDYVLGDMPVSDLDAVAISVNPRDADGLAMMKDGVKYRHGPRELNPWECETFEVLIKGVKLPAYQVQHQVAHIASSYYVSNFTSAIGLSYDASYWPENQVSYMCECLDNKIYLQGCPNLNAGILYDQVTRCIFGSWQNAGKTMGLAGYGAGRFDYQPRDINGTMMMLSSVINAGEHRQNWAMLAQKWLEDDVHRVLSEMSDQHRKIVVSGGTALNVVANRQYYDYFDNAFIAPFCKDSGQAVGGALYVLHHVNDVPLKVYKPQEVAFLGKDYTTYTPEHYDLNPVLNELLSDGVVFWHQGRSEQGPRALTHRSIFARADNTDVKVKVSEGVKGREAFRPLAPIVKSERCADFFDVEPCALTDFMLVNARVTDERLEGVTHVDGTARVQTVSKTFNPVVWKLLDMMEDVTGLPVLINTSLNIAGEPICETHTDTLDTFKRVGEGLLWLDGEVHTETP